MKRTTFKLMALVLSLTMFICLLPFGAAAVDDDTQYATGCIPEDYDTIKERMANSLNRLGDVNGDYTVSIADAKAILVSLSWTDPDNPFRLPTYSEEQDVNIDGKISLADAKQILRVCAGLDVFRAKVDLEVGQDYETYFSYDKGSYVWTCAVLPESELDVIKVFDTLPDGAAEGTVPMHLYKFTAKAPGTYEAVLKFENSETHDIDKEIIYTFNVN